MNLKPERVYNRQFTVSGVDGWSVPAHSALALFKVILVTAWDYWVFKRVGIQVAVIMSERVILNNLQITIHKSNRNKHIAKKLYFIELSKTLWHWVSKDNRGEFLPGTFFQNTFPVICVIVISMFYVMNWNAMVWNCSKRLFFLTCIHSLPWISFLGNCVNVVIL